MPGGEPGSLSKRCWLLGRFIRTSSETTISKNQKPDTIKSGSSIGFLRYSASQKGTRKQWLPSFQDHRRKIKFKYETIDLFEKFAELVELAGAVQSAARVDAAAPGGVAGMRRAGRLCAAAVAVPLHREAQPDAARGAAAAAGFADEAGLERERVARRGERSARAGGAAGGTFAGGLRARGEFAGGGDPDCVAESLQGISRGEGSNASSFAPFDRRPKATALCAGGIPRLRAERGERRSSACAGPIRSRRG